jgi:hypothetical protein
MGDNQVLPTLLILDMDGTIIGDSSWQTCFETIIDRIEPGQVDGGIVKNTIRICLRKGFLRPFFIEFFNFLVGSFSNIEIFIYTAAEHSWAMKIIESIEAEYEIKFNRPVFSREYCGWHDRDSTGRWQMKKDIDILLPILFKKLSSKYCLIGNENLKERMLIVDDSPDVYHDKALNIIQCIPYRHIVPIDILSILPGHVVGYYYKDIADMLKRKMGIEVSRYRHKDFTKQFRIIYLKYTLLTQMSSKDDFWKTFQILVDFCKDKKITPETLKTWAIVMNT